MSVPATTRFHAGQASVGEATGKEATALASAGTAEPTDEMLIARIQQDDQEALGQLFGRFARRVRSIAGRILRDAAEAEDLVQDFFLFIRRKAHVFNSSKGTAASWLVQMAYQRTLDRRRYLTARNFYADGESRVNLEDMLGKTILEDDYSAAMVFERTGLQKVLGKLSEDQRETIRLFFFEGQTLREISEKLGQSLGNVRNHYYRGLDRLRREMFRLNGRKRQGLNGMANNSADRDNED